MKSMSVLRAIGLATGLLASSPFCFGAAPVLLWNDAAGPTVWNASETNWLDSGLQPVAWQPGAEARFAGSGGTIQLTNDVSATNLSFIGTGYTLLGAGRLSVEGSLTSAVATANGIAANLLSAAGFAKTGAGTLTLSAPSATLTSAVAVAQGTLALQSVAIPGALSVASPGAVSALPAAASGLMGFYYNVTPNSANFASLAAMDAHFLTLTPDLAVSSSQVGTTFDFGSTGTLFPLPYAFGSGSSRTNNFEVVWRGTITAPASDFYTFRITHDDGILLAMDGKMVVNSLANTVTDGTTFLDAGPHDMVLGLYQTTGPSAMQVQVKSLYGSFAMLPNAWLSPYTSVGALSGNGAASLPASGSSFNAAQRTSTTFSGELTGSAGSLFTKSGAGTLTLSSASSVSNAFGGDVAVQGGVLTLATSERLSNTSTVTVAANACLKLAADETLGSLSGAGTITLGGGSSVFVSAFTGEADSGLATNKVYTHLLDFPDNGNPASTNGVTFVSAGMSGSTNGYSWSTVNPPPSMWNSTPFDSSYTGVDRLLWDFYYGSPDYTLTLAGLHPGQAYETRLYFRSFGGANPNSPRKVTFSFASGAAFVGAVYYNPDTYTRSWVSCRYTADDAGTLSIRVISHDINNTCHLYGLSNEETTPPAPAQAPAAITWPRAVAFTNDADSDISIAKTYTHKLDFPTYTPAAIVNGVTFTAAAMSGSADGYAWNTTGTVPTGTWGDSSGTGVDNLLYDFYYGSTNFTLTLSGLHPGQVYEARIYIRSFGGAGSDTLRDAIFTFTAGSTVIGSITHDLDTLVRSRIECRYTADAAGTLSIRVISLNSGNTCHLYGLSNEEVNSQPKLTLNTPAACLSRFTGPLTGYGTLTKQGSGTQTFGGAYRLATPIDVQAGTLSFEPGASVPSGVVVRAGATVAAPTGNVRFGGLEGAGTFSLAGNIPYPVTNLVYQSATFTNDAGTGISSNKVYTHKLDFGTRSSPATVINGVTFDKVTTVSGTLNGYGWANFPPLAHGGNSPEGLHGVATNSGIYNLLYDMDYGLQFPGAATMQLTGLTLGKRYEVRFYNRSWGWNGGRTQTLTFDPDGSGPISEAITFNPDALDPNFVAYRYTAASSTLAITVQSMYTNSTYHIYGLSNEETSDAAYTPVTVDIAKDSVLSGPLTGAGGWVKTGAATLTLTATNSATGALTVSAGALAVTNGNCGTLGPVTVASGATLFGDGSLGGNVSIASNAWLRVGTPTACGTLQIGGSLTLAQGTLLAYRFGLADSNDTVTVNGLLTFPASGVVQASAIGAGAKAPTKDVFFASSQTISGPANLSGWTVVGVNKSMLTYSADRKTIYFSTPRGMMICIK